MMSRCADYNQQSENAKINESKRAIEALAVILFVLYVILTIAAYVLNIIRKESFAAYAAKKLMNEIVYKHWYYFFLFVMFHVLEPWAFPVVMIWIWAVIFLIHCALHFVFGNHKLKLLIMVTYGILALYAIFLTIILLADNWCVFFKGRGNHQAGAIAYS